MDKLKLFTGNSHPEFAKRLAKLLDVELRKIDIHWFGNDNVQIDLGGGPENSVRGCCCFVVQTQTPPVSDNIIELFWIIHTLKKDYGAKHVIAVLPYMPYIRSDKKEDKRRISVGAKCLANLLEAAGATGVVLIDPHFPQIEGFFDIPVSVLKARGLFIDYIEENINPKKSQYVMVAPDFGESKHIGPFSTKLGLGAAIINKHRIGDEEEIDPEKMQLVGKVRGRHCLMVDDEGLSLGTLLQAAEFLVETHGAKDVIAFLTHIVFMSKKFDVYEKLDKNPYVSHVFGTNTIPIPEGKVTNKLTILSVEEIFASKIKEVYNALVK